MHHDRIGSIVALTNSSGTVTNRYKYSPWGESPSMSGTTFGYTAQRLDSETGLYYYKNRHYSPKLGRFLQPDPLGYTDSLNLYQYGFNNPLGFTDPMGLAADGSQMGADTSWGGTTPGSSSGGGYLEVLAGSPNFLGYTTYGNSTPPGAEGGGTGGKGSGPTYDVYARITTIPTPADLVKLGYEKQYYHVSIFIVLPDGSSQSIQGGNFVVPGTAVPGQPLDVNLFPYKKGEKEPVTEGWTTKDISVAQDISESQYKKLLGAYDAVDKYLASAKIPYDYFVNNSNAVAYTILAKSGLKIPVLPYPAKQIPGWGRKLIN